jgi:hypothetical protein
MLGAGRGLGVKAVGRRPSWAQVAVTWTGLTR